MNPIEKTPKKKVKICIIDTGELKPKFSYRVYSKNMILILILLSF